MTTFFTNVLGFEEVFKGVKKSKDDKFGLKKEHKNYSQMLKDPTVWNCWAAIFDSFHHDALTADALFQAILQKQRLEKKRLKKEKTRDYS